MTRRIYLDLDGVMADFDGSFPAVFGLDHRSMADDDMWLKINGHPTFFRDLPPMAGAVDFFRSIEHLEPIILTACPKSNYAHVATQKVEWVRAHLSAHVTVLPVLGGSSKPLFMHAKGDILIDDFRRNTEAWAAAGGHAILHRGFEGTAAALEAAIGPYAAQPAEQLKPEGGEAVAEVYEWSEDDGTSKRCVSFLCPISELPVGTKLYATQPKPEQAVGDGVAESQFAAEVKSSPEHQTEMLLCRAVLNDAVIDAPRLAVATPAEVTDDVVDLRGELQHMVRAYVRLLEIGRDRIVDLGGSCDPLDVMEQGDPNLIQAKRAIALAAQRPAGVPEGWLHALDAAVAAIYFNDSSDYLTALWQVVKHLKPELVDLLESDESAAYEQVKAMLNAAQEVPRG